MAVGPGPRVCKVGHKTNNSDELRGRWRALCAFKGGQNICVSRWWYKQSSDFRRQRKREKVMVGPGPGECKA